MTQLTQEEDQQIQALKEWWAKYGTLVLVLLILVLGSYVGMQWWKGHQNDQAVAAANAFRPVEKAFVDEQYAEAKPMAEAFRNEYPDSPYAVQAALWQARVAVTADKDLAAAEQHLRWALQQLDKDPQSRVVRMRLARVQAAQGQFDAALATLAELAEPGDFAAGYAELRGDILLDKGDRAAALSAYEAALAAIKPGEGDRSGLEEKINDLAVAKAPVEADA